MAFPIDLEMVKRTEAKLGRKLPPGYVAKMCKCNGGSVETEVDAFELHPLFDDSDKKRLKRTCNDIVRESTAAKQWTGIPDGALVIANNGGGDLLILLPDPTADRFCNAVYWWDHETAEVEKVADDFDELNVEGTS